MRNSQQCRVLLWFISDEQAMLSRWIIGSLETKGLVPKWWIAPCQGMTHGYMLA
jgi:hypothetical protein